MGRMHSRGKGMSSSALPYKKSPPSWLKTSSTEVSLVAEQYAGKHLFLWSSKSTVYIRCVGRRADWQVCQEGCNPFPNWCHAEGLSRSSSGERNHREQSVAYLEKERYEICDISLLCLHV